MIVAINKIDKEGAQPDRVKQELTQYGLTPEEWGGETIMVPVECDQGENLIRPRDDPAGDRSRRTECQPGSTCERNGDRSPS